MPSVYEALSFTPSTMKTCLAPPDAMQMHVSKIPFSVKNRKVRQLPSLTHCLLDTTSLATADFFWHQGKQLNKPRTQGRTWCWSPLEVCCGSLAQRKVLHDHRWGGKS